MWYHPVPEALPARSQSGGSAAPLLRITNLEKRFPVGRRLLRKEPKNWLRAVDGVSLEVAAGETLGLVGESGCGKSTLGRLAIRLLEPTGGSIHFAGHDITHLGNYALRPLRQRFQMVFQDPAGALDSRFAVGESVAEPLLIARSGNAKERREKAREMLDTVGIGAEALARFPHEFSGGQRQRICIARALVVRPDLIVADEAVSALDVSVRAQVINLFQDVQERFGLAYLFISHDLSIVRHIADRVAVMYLGQIVETGSREVLRDPAHPYSKALLAAAPPTRPDPTRQRTVIEGDLPSPLAIPSGCRYHTRCPLAVERCRVEAPTLREVGSGRSAACHFV
jgi:oligopeptide/dipeptide ABC transporter ATP-binding protein